MPIYIPNLDTAVEAADAVTNVTPGDVIGNKDSTPAGDDLVALSKRVLYGRDATIAHPVTPAGVQLTAGAANTYGNYSELVAATAADERLTFLCVHTPSAGYTGTVEIAVGAGAAEVPICEVPVAVETDVGLGQTINISGMGGLIATGSRIAARFMTTAGGTTANVVVTAQVA